MGKIVVNNRVRDLYEKGMSLNDAIKAEFGSEIEQRQKENESFKNFSPLNMVMYDAGIDRYSKLEKIIDQSTMYTSGGMESNTWLFPAWVDSTLHEAMYASDLINYLVSESISVDSNIVKSAMLNLMDGKNRNNIKVARVAEGADLPLAKISIGEKAISLWKHGRAIETTYEAVRRMTIPMWNRHMSAIVSDLAHQNVEAAADVIANGDGNNNAATLLADMSTNGITANALIDALWDYNFKTNFNANTIIANKDDAKTIAKMVYNSQEVPGGSGRLSFNLPQFAPQNINVIAVDELKISGSNAILVFNRENTLNRYTENGSNIQEAQTFIRNQTNLMTFSENSGYAINVAGSNMYIKTKTSTT